MTSATRTLSLNEVEQLGLKAGRGAGASWGVAEDIGRAARWLAAHGLDWSGALLELLGTPPSVRFLSRALAVADGLAGAAPGGRWAIEGCALGWALPVLAAAQRDGGPVLEVVSAAATVRLRPGGPAETDRPLDRAVLFAPGPVAVTALAHAPALPYPLGPATRRSTVPLAALAALEALASRTAVPASARSRAAGAGGGRVDDD